MSKVRLYKVHRKDAYRTWFEVVPAHSGKSAEDYFDNSHISSTAEFLGFQDVEILYDGSEFVFLALGYTFESNSAGYPYLCSYLAASINSLIVYLQNDGLYP